MTFRLDRQNQQAQNALMTRDLPSATTYCMKHERLEAVESVIHAAPFQVYEQATKTERHGCEVRAITKTGCKVFFIGGPRWNS